MAVMRYISLLLVLLLSLPAAAWAKTVPVHGGRSKTKLTPQQVQFMRWWRAQTIRVAKPVKPSTKPSTKSSTKPRLTVKVTRRNVKVVRINTNTKRRVVVPGHKISKTTQANRTPSLLTLKSVLLKMQSSPATKLSSDGPRVSVVRVKRRVARRTERDVPRRETKKPKTVKRAAKRLVIVQQSSEPPPPPPSALTTLRYQLELSQME